MRDPAALPTARTTPSAPGAGGETLVAAPAAGRVAPEVEGEAPVRRYFEELLSGGDPARAGDLFAEDYVAHDPSLPSQPPGPGGVALHALASRTAFPDQRLTVDDLFAAGDRVAVRFTLRDG
jgi:hypothetical protein